MCKANLYYSDKIKNADHEKEMRETFRVMDKDGEGFISAAAMKMLVTKLGKLCYFILLPSDIS